MLTFSSCVRFVPVFAGAFRMRGIGIGQTIELLVIPEVLELMHANLAAAQGLRGGAAEHRKSHEALGEWGGAGNSSSSKNDRRTAQLCKDVAAWLCLNQMKSEKTQFNLLCEQTVCNVWRKRDHTSRAS